jgi:hypothetical protein
MIQPMLTENCYPICSISSNPDKPSQIWRTRIGCYYHNRALVCLDMAGLSKDHPREQRTHHEVWA